MSGIHQKTHQQQHPPPTYEQPRSGASIPVDTLWNIAINIVLLGCILAVGWMCYRAFKRYVLFRISQWTGTSPRGQSGDDDENGGGGDDEEEEFLRQQSAAAHKKSSSVRYRK